METIYPIFKKDPAHFYKVIDKETCIQVMSCYDDFKIKRVNIECAYLQSEDSTEAEFLEAFYQVRKKLNQLCDINFDLL